MYKFLVTFCICISVVCYSAILHEFDDVDFEKILVSGFDANLNHIKQSYLKQIHELKEKAVNCTFDGSCFDIAEKVAMVNKLFRRNAEEMKDLQKESLELYQRRHYIRCIDCIYEYFDDVFSDFCDDMDDVQSEVTVPPSISNSSLVTMLHALLASSYLNVSSPSQATSNNLNPSAPTANAIAPIANVPAPTVLPTFAPALSPALAPLSVSASASAPGPIPVPTSIPIPIQTPVPIPAPVPVPATAPSPAPTANASTTNTTLNG